MKFYFKEYHNEKWYPWPLPNIDPLFKRGVVVGGSKHWSHTNVGEQTLMAYPEYLTDSTFWWQLKRIE